MRGWTITLAYMELVWWSISGRGGSRFCFTLFEPTEDEGPVVVVFLPMFKHPSATSSSNVENPLTKSINRLSNLEIEALTSKKSTKLQDFKPQAKSFVTLHASMELKLWRERKWWGMVPNMVQNGAWNIGRQNLTIEWPKKPWGGRAFRERKVRTRVWRCEIGWMRKKKRKIMED